jgi:tetratricopeptide (TPR) repeat protein
MPQGRLEVVPSFPSRGPRGPWLEIHTGLAKALRLQRDEVPALRAALRAAAPRSPDAYLRVGRAIGDIAEHAAAAAVLREGLAQFPGDFGLRWNLAMMLHHLGENDAAQQHLDAALKVDVDPQALALQGNLFVVGKQLERASAAFARALELRPMSSTTWRRQARVLVSLGRLEEAAQAFRRAIAGDPEAAEAYRRLAQVHLRLGQTARALQVLRQGASRSMGNRLDLVVQRAVGDARLRDAEDAIRQATAATRREPGDGRTHLHLAFALQLAGRSNGVAEHLARARHLGADRACCAGLELLQALEGGAKDRVREFLTVFERELNTPTREPLRATIAAILRQRLGR